MVEGAFPKEGISARIERINNAKKDDLILKEREGPSEDTKQKFPKELSK